MDIFDASPVRCEVRIDAELRRVYEYFTDPACMLGWKGIDARLETRPGDEYSVNVAGKHVARGRYLELRPHSRVVFTWGWEAEDHPVAPGSSVVEIDLIEADGGTLVRLTHSELPIEVREQHSLGWEHYLERLTTAGSGSDPGPDPWVVQDS